MRFWSSEPNRPTIEHFIVVIVFVFLFVVAITAVFLGFVGYYSRVSLSSELQKDKAGENIDYVFMIVDQIEKDDKSLNDFRIARKSIEEDYNKKANALRSEGYSSKEFADFFTSKVEIVGLFYQNVDKFSVDYWKDVSSVLFSNSPDEFQKEIIILVNPVYRTNTAASDVMAFKHLLIPLVQKTFQEYLKYNSKYKQNIYDLDLVTQSARESVARNIREILTRNPQLASNEELTSYLGLEKPNLSSYQQTAQHRAILRSFDNLFLGQTRMILEWPTIASTLLVTLATGWLGGLVNFTGLAVRLPASTGGISRGELNLGNLFRRSFLGITAALGIFLFAGSGLLVLTAQSANPASGSSVELSPYFVAFLAFISGFLADDAFAALTSAGHRLFSSKEARDQSDPAPPERETDPTKAEHKSNASKQKPDSTPAPSEGQHKAT